MPSEDLPPIDGLSGLAATERVRVLDLLFEPSTQLHTLSLGLLHDTRFSSYQDLIASIGVQLIELAESSSTSDSEWLDKILGSHPRLGEKNVESEQSKAEQAQLHTGGSDQELLATLNTDYEQTFPGLRYV